MTEQIGTLEELGVKPGDVVENVSHEEYKGLQWTCHDAHPKGFVDQPCVVYHKNGRSSFMHVYNRDKYKWRIISRATTTPSIDLTAITTPFGLLDKATQEALRAHGGPVEQYTSCGWRPHVMHKVSYHPSVVYRVKPSPKRETVTKIAYMTSEGCVSMFQILDSTMVTITYDTIDGEIDMATYKVTKK